MYLLLSPKDSIPFPYHAADVNVPGKIYAGHPPAGDRGAVRVPEHGPDHNTSGHSGS